VHPIKSIEGIAIYCDEMGKILEVIQNDISGVTIIKRDALFPSIVERESMGKALSFLLDIRRKGTTSDWELNLNLDGKIKTLHFTGTLQDNRTLVVGTATRSSTLELYDELTKKNPEERESTRDFDEAQADPRYQKAVSEDIYFDELTRLYNELSNVQRELAKQNVEIKRLSDLKNKFLGMVAHDLRNPIWMIGMYSKFLQEEASELLNEEQMDFLDIIKSHSESMRKLVDSYLDYATIESGRLKLELKPTDLNVLIKNNVRMNQPIASKKEIELQFTHEKKLLEVKIDASKIDQVLNNLISNAIRFSLSQTKISVHVSRYQYEVVIAVKDEGVGIPKEKQEVLFEPFEGEKGFKENGEKSAGLGLYIVQKIVQEHGGRIWVESAVGEGSTFFVALPIRGVGK
jgi:two-component system OmpR family sensor kinase